LTSAEQRLKASFMSSVQRHGALLALAEHDLAIVLASENVGEIVGVPLEQVLGAGIAAVLDEPTEKPLRELLAHDDLALSNPIAATSRDGRMLDATLHRTQGMLVIELEPATRRFHAGAIVRILERMHAAPELPRALVAELAALVGMDRIAVYRHAGELVVAHGATPAFVSLDGGETIRFIADRAAAPVALRAAALLGNASIELTGNVLRSYPTQGTGAQLVLAAGDWGVVVCEHPEPKHIEQTVRLTAQVVARTAGWVLDAREHHPHAHADVPTAQLTDVRVLVVDDDPDQSDMLGLLLQAAGATTQVAYTATAALAAFHSFRPEVVVSDVSLPDKDGFTFMRELRALGSEEGGWIPAVSISGHADPEHAREAILAGFQLHLPKPIDPPDLIARLARLVGRTARRT
jgi:light-regulated signal transduction histidine kinase (bacteriophytochrome)